MESKYSKELEEVKATSQKEIKELETKLERSNNLVSMYDSALFKAYNEIWIAMINAKSDLECAIAFTSIDISTRFDEETKNFEKCRISYNKFFDTYHLNSLFISSEVREAFNEMINELNDCKNLFSSYRLNPNSKDKTTYEILKIMNSDDYDFEIANIWYKALREASEKIQNLIQEELNIKTKF